MGLAEQAIDYEAQAEQAYADWQRFTNLAQLARDEASQRTPLWGQSGA